MPFTNSFEVHIANEDLIFVPDTSVHIQWSPESIFPTDIHGSDMYTVDIEFFELNVNTGNWETVQRLSHNIANSGSAVVRVPSLQDLGRRTLENPFSPMTIGVGLSSAAVGSNFLEKLGQLGLRTFKYTPIRFLSIFEAFTALNRVACEAWSLSQPENIGDEIKRRLPPCPTTMSVIEAPNSGFSEERLSSTVNFLGAIQNYLGTTVIDEAFRTFFHPQTDKCFRQIVRSK